MKVSAKFGLTDVWKITQLLVIDLYKKNYNSINSEMTHTKVRSLLNMVGQTNEESEDSGGYLRVSLETDIIKCD